MRRPSLRWLPAVLAAAGLAYAIVFAVRTADREAPAPTAVALPAESGFPATIAASGIVEASSRDIAVGSFLPGIVVRVPVVEGQRVKAGDPLFVVDQRAAEAEFAVATRDLAADEARVAEAETLLADREDQLRRVQRLKPGEVVTEDRLVRIQFLAQAARAGLASARAEVEAARARVSAARVTLDRLTVRAPVDGRVLKLDVRPGQFVVAGETDIAPVLLGEDSVLHVRAQVDENDIWRLRPGAAAEAVVRGNRDIRFALTFVRVEPFVAPKRNLTGDITERVDTRVLEVIYRFDPTNLPIFVGQQVDVFIEAPPAAAS